MRAPQERAAKSGHEQLYGNSLRGRLARSEAERYLFSKGFTVSKGPSSFH
jgi:hypothetical protein